MAEDKVLKIEKVSEKDGLNEGLNPDPVERVAPNKDRFDELVGVDQGRREVEIHSPQGQKASLLDEIRDLNTQVDAVSKSSPDVLVAQTKDVIQKIEDVKTQLASPDLQLKDSVQNLLKNKLSHIDDSLKVVMNRAGLEYTPQNVGEKNGLASPIERFIGFLTNGQYQLQKLSSDVQMMHLNGENISPASMLAIQVKVGFVQQELEFFSNVLNKALESTKTIMNVQI